MPPDKLLKANGRGRILPWSNCGLLPGFSRVFTSSPTAPMMLDSSDGTHCWGEEAKPPVFGRGWRLCCVGPPHNDIPPLPAAVTREPTYHRGFTPQPAIRWF